MKSIKKAIIIISCLILLIIVGSGYNRHRLYMWFDMRVNPPIFIEIELEKVAFSYFAPSECTPRIAGTHWRTITAQASAHELAQRYDLILPDIDFEAEMFVVSMGSELELLDYDKNEPIYRTKGKFIGFPVFSRDRTYNLIVVYRVDRVPLMSAEGAGFIVPYMGRGREHGGWGWGLLH